MCERRLWLCCTSCLSIRYCSCFGGVFRPFRLIYIKVTRIQCGFRRITIWISIFPNGKTLLDCVRVSRIVRVQYTPKRSKTSAMKDSSSHSSLARITFIRPPYSFLCSLPVPLGCVTPIRRRRSDSRKGYQRFARGESQLP